MQKGSLKKIISSALLLFFGLVIFSCSDSTPQLISVQPVVLLDYADFNSLPKSSISLFILTGSAPQRAASVVVTKNDASLTWYDSSPQIFTVGTNKYVCVRNICPSYKTAVQKGRYDIVYEDLAGNEVKSSFNISFNDNIMSARPDEVNSFFGNSIEFLAVYDTSGDLINFSTPKAYWTSDDEIKKELKTAFLKRKCFLADNNTVMVLMPPEQMK